MRPSFHPRLINGPFLDPGLLVSWVFQKRALLFDLGELGNLPTTDILKISHIFVSHTHMDHFLGFDHLVRLMLGRPKTVSLFGPPGFLSNVNGKLQGYTWNLVHNYAESLALNVFEVHSGYCIGQTFRCRSGFQPEGRIETVVTDGVLHEDADVTITTTTLDHSVPCLAYAMQEPFHINIRKTALENLGLATGPWLSHFKALLFKKADPATPIHAPSMAEKPDRTFELATLARQIAHTTRGQKIAYVADAAYTPDNVQKIVALAFGADHLFIEATFLQADHDIARAKHHLTARQAGLIARQAGVRRMTIFHFSPRYLDRESLLEAEAREAFEG